jgi:hypothetical protein
LSWDVKARHIADAYRDVVAGKPIIHRAEAAL